MESFPFAFTISPWDRSTSWLNKVFSAARTLEEESATAQRSPMTAPKETKAWWFFMVLSSFQLLVDHFGCRSSHKFDIPSICLFTSSFFSRMLISLWLSLVPLSDHSVCSHQCI